VVSFLRSKAVGPVLQVAISECREVRRVGLMRDWVRTWVEIGIAFAAS
jgi:hypothetical protein